MAYGLKEIELMISNLPNSGIIPSLDTAYLPQRRHVKAKAWVLPFHTRARKIINALIQRDDLPKSETIYAFVDCIAKQHPTDKNVKRLMNHFSV